MVEEIRLLVQNYSGRKWNQEVQKAFADDLRNADFFKGTLGHNDFSVRDRITRGPKAYGFVNLKPIIELTEPGNLFINGKRPHEIFTRQLLKFQLPSPYHVDKGSNYFVKPFLELLRMVYELDGLTKHEIALFFTELIHIDKYEIVKSKIEEFRQRKKNINRNVTSYNRLVDEYFSKQIEHIYSKAIDEGNLKLRESTNKSLKRFKKTKRRNHMDYADAAIRYLRATYLTTLQPRTFKMIVSPEKIKEVEYLLSTVQREPILFENEEDFKNYLFNPAYPVLLNDDIDGLYNDITRLENEVNLGIHLDIEKHYKEKNIEELKNIKELLLEYKVSNNVSNQKSILESYGEYEDIQQVFEDIRTGNAVEPALIFEWNAWRGFVMLNDGEISGNFRVDDNGMPLFTALANKPDIECEYGDFNMIVEVTTSTGQKQYEMEGEPVPRHLALHKRKTGKETYCIFIAKSLNEATLAHFFALHKIKIRYYGGNVHIIPLNMSDYQKMLEVAYSSPEKPKSEHIYNFLKFHSDQALRAEDEIEWYSGIQNSLNNWLELEVIH